jgi:hypothetical protein
MKLVITIVISIAGFCLSTSAQAQEPWERVVSLNIGEQLDQDRIHGVIFDGDLTYLAVSPAEGSNSLYSINRDGEIVENFDQLGTARYGYKGLAWDGERIWGSGEQRIFGFSPEGDSVISFNGPVNPNVALTYDPDREALWTCGITTDIFRMDLEGNVVARLDRRGFRIYALAYWQDDPDGFPLYIFHTPQAENILVYKMNPDNGDTLFVRRFDVAGSNVEGAMATDLFMDGWAMVTTTNCSRQAGGDMLDVFYLGAPRIRLQAPELVEGFELDQLTFDVVGIAAEGVELSLDFDPGNLPEGATFEDQGDGTGIFQWQPQVGDTGLFTPTFTLSDGENEVSTETAIWIYLFPLIWKVIPDTVSVEANDFMEFTVNGASLQDRAVLTLGFSGANLPEAAAFEDRGDGRGLFSWQTTVRDTGEYQAVFTLSDNHNRTLEEQVRLIVTPPPDWSDPVVAPPTAFGLISVYPNPFNSSATISFSLASIAPVSLDLVDITGHPVKSIYSGVLNPGPQAIIMNGEGMPAGLYILRLVTTEKIRQTRLILLK